MIDSTTAASPATLRAISAITVKVVTALNFSSACTIELAKVLIVAQSKINIAIFVEWLLDQLATSGNVIGFNIKLPCLDDCPFVYPNNISHG